MNFTFTGARSLVAIVAIAGVTGTAATTASAATHSKKTHATHAKRLHKKSGRRGDLVASGLTAVETDTGFDVSASVANQGKGFAKGSDVVIALSDDTTLDDDDAILDEYHVSSLAAGVTRSFDDAVDLPDGIDSDTAYLIVCADGNQELTESNETNNCVAQQVDTSDFVDESADDDGSDDSGAPASGDASDAPIVLIGGQS